MYAETLKLVATLEERRPSPRLPERLHALFQRLGDDEAPPREKLEDEIWRLWMAHRDRAAAFDLERATRAMAAEDWGVADQILRGIVGSHPDYAEAWNKRATLYYIHGKDAESVRYLHRALELEPRHYGAICGFAEILLSNGEEDAALFAFGAALRINPHIEEARKAMIKLAARKPAISH